MQRLIVFVALLCSGCGASSPNPTLLSAKTQGADIVVDIAMDARILRCGQQTVFKGTIAFTARDCWWITPEARAAEALSEALVTTR